MTHYPRLDPKEDIVFKLLFSKDEEILIALLTAVLKPSLKIVRAIVTNPEIDKAFADDKGGAMDIVVQLDDGSLIDVEMQASRERTWRARTLFYAAHLLTSQLEAGQSHGELRPVISILFLDFREFYFEHFHEVFRLTGASGHIFSPLLTVHTLELPKVGRASGTDDTLLNWCQYLRAERPDEIERLRQADPMIHKAEDRLTEIASDPQARLLLTIKRMHEKGARLVQSMERAAAREEGLEEGRAAGREEGRAAGREEGREGMARVLLLLLEERFGQLPQMAMDRVNAACIEQLQVWARRAMSASDLDEVFLRSVGEQEEF
ncbi:MAG TPA: Rpn family recombination-promoting nuclease/putative transposase [Polyangiaceae bacterium]|nr:Rpn family recombination-promoting nuclease/putative transposase [Polyangiaceae bacterium]